MRKSQLCLHIFHLTHCDSHANFLVTVIWNEINLHSKWVQESFSSICARYFIRSLFFLESRACCTCRSGTVQLRIGELSTKHDVPQCGMANPHGENPGAVSILHEDVKSNHLANGVGSAGSELCPVTLMTLSHIITKSADGLQTSPRDIPGTVGSAPKCRRASTL